MLLEKLYNILSHFNIFRIILSIFIKGNKLSDIHIYI